MREGRTRTVLLLILLLALGLRLINLGGRTLWYDEAFAVLFAEKGWDAMVDGTLTEVEGGAADVHPLLYYMSLNLWMQVFGESAAAVRLYSVLIGVATVLAVFLLARDWFGDQTALVAALITAVAPFHIQYSQETRMYALLGLILTLATWVYWRAWQRGRWGYWLAVWACWPGSGCTCSSWPGCFCWRWDCCRSWRGTGRGSSRPGWRRCWRC